MLIPSKRYSAWYEEKSWELKQYHCKPIEECIISMDFYIPDKRASDMDNLAASVLDLLVGNRIIKDDSWKIVKEIHLKFVCIDRENPRVEVELEEMVSDEPDKANCH